MKEKQPEETEKQLKENKPAAVNEPKQVQGQEQKQKSAAEQVEEYKELLQRLQADFENYKKRVEKDVGHYKFYTNAELVKKLLPVLDSFELAIKNCNADSEKFRKGIELVYAQLYSALEAEGLKGIKAVGEKFNPYFHEAIMQGEGEEEKILDELQKGYIFRDAVLRHSKVKVGKGVSA